MKASKKIYIKTYLWIAGTIIAAIITGVGRWWQWLIVSLFLFIFFFVAWWGAKMDSEAAKKDSTYVKAPVLQTLLKYTGVWFTVSFMFPIVNCIGRWYMLLIGSIVGYIIFFLPSFITMYESELRKANLLKE